MAATTVPAAWGALRFLSGVASAVLFVAITIEVTERMSRTGYGRWSGALYGGIGLGIAATGTIAPMLDSLGGWRAAWAGMGALGALLSAMGLALAHKRNPAVEAALPDTAVPSEPGALRPLRLLAAAYFLEGLGYVVSVTFIVAMVARTPGLEAFAPWSWVAVGLAAAPSTVAWQWAGRRIGAKRALLLAYAVQCAGILAGIGADTVPMVLLSAVFFGGTMLGIVTLAMGEGSRRAGRDARRAAAVMTACFGAGQVLGPPVAGRIADARDGFTIPLLMAAAAVAAGAALLLADRNFPEAGKTGDEPVGPAAGQAR
jgi:predicted MFS family arabinose efflux permease